jgi:hypothetical protein
MLVSSKSCWRRKKERFSARGRKGAAVRWARAHADSGPVRVSRWVEITIRDSHRPMEVIRARRDVDDEGRWGRWRVDDYQGRPLGARGLGMLVGGFVE